MIPAAGGIAPLVLFDLDGTLVDSAVDLLNAINAIALRESAPPVSLSTLRPHVSRGGRAMLSVAFPDRDTDQRELLLQPFLDVYAHSVSAHSTPFDGVAEVLEAIEQAGCRWGIVSNKPHYLAVGVVAGMGWSNRCSVLLGGDSLPRRKPDPDQLLHACALLGVDPAQCVYVGDDQRDILAARSAGMKSIAALWGYRLPTDDPGDWNADVTLGHPSQMLDAGVLAVAAGLP